jgi:hypothetical protein
MKVCELRVGVATNTPVEQRWYQMPLKFTGKINKITLSIDCAKLSPEEIKKLEPRSGATEASD